MKELPGAGYAERTRQNVHDSDATVIFHHGELRGGTAETLRYCRELNRPHLVLGPNETTPSEAAESVRDFLRDKKIATLNIAGPRASEWPDGYNYASRVLEIVLREFAR